MPTMLVVCARCGLIIREVEVSSPPLGMSHGLCNHCAELTREEYEDFLGRSGFGLNHSPGRKDPS